MPFKKSTKTVKKTKKIVESDNSKSDSESELDFKNESSDSDNEEEKKPSVKTVKPKGKTTSKDNFVKGGSTGKKITKKITKKTKDDDDDNLSKLVDSSDSDSKSSEDSKSDDESLNFDKGNKGKNKYKKNQLTVEEISKQTLAASDNISIMRYLLYRGLEKPNINPWLSSNMKRMLHESRHGIPTSNSNNFRSSGNQGNQDRGWNSGGNRGSNSHYQNRSHNNTHQNDDRHGNSHGGHFNRNNQKRFDNVEDFYENDSGVVNFKTTTARTNTATSMGASRTNGNATASRASRTLSED
jgi:hypothetical protein